MGQLKVGHQRYEIGDVVVSFEAEPIFVGERFQDGQGVQTIQTSQGIVQIRTKFRPAIVVAIFPDHFQAIPMYTHNGRVLEALANKPQDRQDVACLLSTRSLAESIQRHGRDGIPSERRLTWQRHIPGNVEESIVYHDTVKTVKHAMLPAPIKIGRLANESAARLVKLYRDSLTKGMQAAPTIPTAPHSAPMVIAGSKNRMSWTSADSGASSGASYSTAQMAWSSPRPPGAGPPAHMRAESFEPGLGIANLTVNESEQATNLPAAQPSPRVARRPNQKARRDSRRDSSGTQFDFEL